MKKLNSFKYLKTFLFCSVTISILRFEIFAQTYHDCTSTQDLNSFLEQNGSSEEVIDLMELELAKSLSKFDECVDSDYLETNKIEDRNESENTENLDRELEKEKEQERKTSGKKLTEQKEQESKSSSKELAEQKEQESKSFGKELAEQKTKDNNIEDLVEKKQQEIDKTNEKSYKANNDLNNFSSKNNEEESFNKNTNNTKIVNSVASSELSGTEISEENLEDASIFENNISEESAKYENDHRFENGEKYNGMVPEDIPQDDNDSVLEEQIRLAAMNEKDPEKKKRLWNEYRKYKGLPQKK